MQTSVPCRGRTCPEKKQQGILSKDNTTETKTRRKRGISYRERKISPKFSCPKLFAPPWGHGHPLRVMDVHPKCLFLHGNFVGDLAGILREFFGPAELRLKILGENFGAFFPKETRSSKKNKIVRTSSLQTCHPNEKLSLSAFLLFLRIRRGRGHPEKTPFSKWPLLPILTSAELLSCSHTIGPSTQREHVAWPECTRPFSRTWC